MRDPAQHDRPAHRGWHVGTRVRLLADLALATGVLLVGLGSAPMLGGHEGFAAFLSLFTAVVAVAVRRVALPAAVGLAVLAGLSQVVAGRDVSVVQVAMLLVVYSTAAHGSRTALWLSGAALPVVAVVAALHLLISDSVLVGVASAWRGSTWVRGLLLWALPLAALGIAWLLGALRRAGRLADEAGWRAQVAEVEARRAAQLTALQEQRTQLARDVHDVVGHSLAVVVAQADSVRFQDLDDPDAAARAQQAVAAIAATARQSLGDVRAVLARLSPTTQLPELDGTSLPDLFERVLHTGVDLRVHHEGEPHDLPEQTRTELVAVVRELLTNALRHGTRERPIEVLQRWDDAGLLVRVRNGRAAGPGAAAGSAGSGQGLAGVRQRLAGIGGQLSAGASGPSGDDFVATAWLPVRAATTDEAAVP